MANILNYPENQVPAAYQIPFDIIPLPSEGKLYPNKVSKVKVEMLTTNDENILLSPNLIQNGQLFDTLLSRKVKDFPLKPEDLLIGDRNAILIFLRATSYGDKYPVKVTDPNTGEEFETEIDLNSLKFKSLGAEPDENGLFDFMLPVSKKLVKFKLLTSKDEKELLQYSEQKMKKMGSSISTLVTDRLNKIIKSVDGNTDAGEIYNFIQVMRAGDSMHLREYYNSIEPGFETKIEIQSPNGGVITTFFRIGPDFFYPNLRLS